jgi:hypothetical protein
VTHAAPNKDRGIIDPATGSKAVAGAVVESRRQWQDLQAELRVKYGTVRGERMICALTHDDPVNACRDAGWSRLLGVVLVAAAVVVAAAAVILLVGRRRRRRAA